MPRRRMQGGAGASPDRASVFFAMTDASTPKPTLADGDRGSLEPDVDELGVDLTLVRETLRMSPNERLRALESYMNAFASVRVIRRAALEPK